MLGTTDSRPPVDEPGDTVEVTATRVRTPAPLGSGRLRCFRANLDLDRLPTSPAGGMVVVFASGTSVQRGTRPAGQHAGRVARPP